MGANSSQPVVENDEDLSGSIAGGNLDRSDSQRTSSTFKSDTGAKELNTSISPHSNSTHSEKNSKRKDKGRKGTKKKRKSSDSVKPDSDSVVSPSTISNQDARNSIHEIEVDEAPNIPQSHIQSPVASLLESVHADGPHTSEDDIAAASSQLIQDSQAAMQTGHQTQSDIIPSSCEDDAPNSLPILASDNKTSAAEGLITSPESPAPNGPIASILPGIASKWDAQKLVTPRKQSHLKPKAPIFSTTLRCGTSLTNTANSIPDSSEVQIQASGSLKSRKPSASQDPKPSATKRKRRLPVEDLTDDATVGEPNRKKSRKSIGTPKPSKARRTEAVVTDGAEQPKRRRSKTAATISGPFTEEEIQTIKLQMLKFREAHDMSEYDQNELIADNPSALSKQLFDQICEEMPYRDRISIMKHCRRRYHNFGVRGAWSPEDDEQLRQAYKQHPKQWRLIGKLIGRHQEDVRDRYRNYLICGDQQEKGYWSLEEEAKLKSVVKDMLDKIAEMKLEDVQRNPNSTEFSEPDIQYVDWNLVSEKLNHTRSRLQCIEKWKLLVAREKPMTTNGDIDLSYSSRIDKAKDEIKGMSRADKLELLRDISNTQAGAEIKIPWSHVGSHEFQNRYSTLARKLAWKIMRSSINGHKTKPLQKIVARLIRKYSAPGSAEDMTGFSDFANYSDIEDASSDEPKVRMKTPRIRKPRTKIAVTDPNETSEYTSSKSDSKARRARKSVNSLRPIQSTLSSAVVHSSDEESEQLHVEEQENTLQVTEAAPKERGKKRSKKRKRQHQDEEALADGNEDMTVLNGNRNHETPKSPVKGAAKLSSPSPREAIEVPMTPKPRANGRNRQVSSDDDSDMDDIPARVNYSPQSQESPLR